MTLEPPSGLEYRTPGLEMNETYGDPHKILAAHRKEIKDWPIVKAGDAGPFR